MSRPSLATVWLDGCSGCHMSLLDMDERLLDIAGRADIVYSPLVDAKEFPPDVDITLVEGAVSTDEEEHKIRRIRARPTTTELRPRLSGARKIEITTAPAACDCFYRRRGTRITGT